MNSAKKMWQKPKMIVLVRSNPEEAVLQGCKSSTVIGPAVGGSSCSAQECQRTATT